MTRDTLFTTNVDTSYQDGRPPKLVKIQIDATDLSQSGINYLGKVSINALQVTIADSQKFYYYDGLSNSVATIDTGAGISFFAITRSDTACEKDTLIDPPWDHTDPGVSHPLDTTFTIAGPIPSEGWYVFGMTMKDAAYHPDEAQGILGNEATDSVVVVYDISNPEISADLVDSCLFEDDRFQLDIVSQDSISGITRISVNVGSTILYDMSFPADSLCSICSPTQLDCWRRYRRLKTQILKSFLKLP